MEPFHGKRESGRPVRLLSNACAATASRSRRTRATETPRGCRRACRSGRAGDGTGSTRRTSAPPPNATAPSRYRVAFGAQRGVGECGELAAPFGYSRHRRHDRRVRSRDDSGVVLVRLATGGSHRRAATPLANRAGWPRSSGRRVACRARRRSNGACYLAWTDRLDSARSGLPHVPPASSNYPQQLATNQSGGFEPASPAARSASDPKCRPVASRATVASTSSQNRSLVLAATSAKGCRCEG